MILITVHLSEGPVQERKFIVDNNMDETEEFFKEGMDTETPYFVVISEQSTTTDKAGCPVILNPSFIVSITLEKL